MSKQRVVIFGKNGQVGSELVQILQENSQFEFQAFGSKDVDFSNIKELQHFLENIKDKPNYIINSAAYTNVDKAEDEKELADLINHKAVEIIAKFCQKNNITLIHYSTDYVFDGSGSEPFYKDNTKNLNPINHYGKTKLDGEKAIIKSGCKYYIFRTSWVYSKNPNHKNFVNTIKKLAKEREELNIIDDQIGAPTNAEFIATKTIKIIMDAKLKSGIYHLTGQKNMSWYEFAKEIISEELKNGEKLLVKKINPIKSKDYKTKAKRPMNSKLKNNFI